MGAGNYVPRDDGWVNEDIRFFYVDTCSWDEQEYEVFEEELRMWADRHSLYSEDAWKGPPRQEMHVIASYVGENVHYVYANVDMALLYWQSDAVVAFCPIYWDEDEPEYAEKAHDLEADKAEELYRALIEDLKRWGYDLGYRTGPWTQGRL